MAQDNNRPTIEVTLDKERVKQMGSEEKLNVLIDIAFQNNALLQDLGKVLYGRDGKEGICETVRTTKNRVIWIWGIFCGVSGFFISLLVYHIVRV